jgi:hypothetical protein
MMNGVIVGAVACLFDRQLQQQSTVISHNRADRGAMA